MVELGRDAETELCQGFQSIDISRYFQVGVLHCDCWALISHQPNSKCKDSYFLGRGWSDNTLYNVYAVTSSDRSHLFSWGCLCQTAGSTALVRHLKLSGPASSDWTSRSSWFSGTSWKCVEPVLFFFSAFKGSLVPDKIWSCKPWKVHTVLMLFSH